MIVLKNIKIADKIIGEGNATFIMAEMAWAHDGSIEKAKHIVKGAADAAADAINIHVTSLSDYMIPHYGSGEGRVSEGKDDTKIYDYLDSINLNNKDISEIISYSKKNGLLLSVMCNDIQSVKNVSLLNPDIYVLASSCFSEEELVREIAKQQKAVFLRIGGATLGEIEKVVLIIQEIGNHNIALIHGFQNYPTKLEDMHIAYLNTLQKMFNLPVGFADHTDGGSQLAQIVPIAAISVGANIIEKHITYDRSEKGEDFESALNPEDFKNLVTNIREIEKSLGLPHMRSFSEAEMSYRQVSKKRTVAKKDLKAGQVLQKGDMTFKRSDEGVYPDESKYLIGRTLKYDINENYGITFDRLM